ncbi:MAG: T9SS type A sorting domain-containing protein [Balneolaceae bacterium]
MPVLFKKFLCIFVFFIWALTGATLAQTYQIPFASKGNTIQLEVINSGNQTGSKLSVVAAEIPEWIQLKRTEITLENLTPNQTETVVFSFDASEDAEVGRVATLRFQILENGETIGTRTFALRSEAPASFELFNNYPNPFNPATTISYQLPEAMNVQIQIYNVLGQLVATLTNESQKPGKYEIRWNASGQASGVYVYRFQGATQGGRTYIREHKMLLIK